METAPKRPNTHPGSAHLLLSQSHCPSGLSRSSAKLWSPESPGWHVPGKTRLASCDPCCMWLMAWKSGILWSQRPASLQIKILALSSHHGAARKPLPLSESQFLTPMYRGQIRGLGEETDVSQPGLLLTIAVSYELCFLGPWTLSSGSRKGVDFQPTYADLVCWTWDLRTLKRMEQTTL